MNQNVTKAQILYELSKSIATSKSIDVCFFINEYSLVIFQRLQQMVLIYIWSMKVELVCDCLLPKMTSECIERASRVLFAIFFVLLVNKPRILFRLKLLMDIALPVMSLGRKNLFASIISHR